MIILNLKDGSALKLDLKMDTDRERFNFLGQNLTSKNSEVVTGIWLQPDEAEPSITLPLPKRFRRVFFYAELLRDAEGILRGERIRVQADEVCLIVTRYYKENGKRINIDLQHTGKSRFFPGGRS